MKQKTNNWQWKIVSFTRLIRLIKLDTVNLKKNTNYQYQEWLRGHVLHTLFFRICYLDTNLKQILTKNFHFKNSLHLPQSELKNQAVDDIIRTILKKDQPAGGMEKWPHSEWTRGRKTSLYDTHFHLPASKSTLSVLVLLLGLSFPLWSSHGG